MSRLAAAATLVAWACACASPARLLDGTTARFRGHQELAESAPWVLGRETPIGICLEPPGMRDTSEWVGRVSGDFVEPAFRLGAMLCFEGRVPAGLADGESLLCLDVRDDYDGATDRSCLPFRYRADDSEFRRIDERLTSLLGGASRLPVETLVAELDALGREARDRGFPVLELRIRLISVYFLRREGSPAALADAEARAAVTPGWVAAPAASRVAAQLHYERATLALDAGALERAWDELRRAEAAFRVVVDPKWIFVLAKQVELLSRVGAHGEAQAKLRFALDQCRSAPCEARLVRAAETTLSWLVLLDPDADRAALEATESRLRTVLAGASASANARERANVLVNLAYARERLGLDPAPDLEQARGLLDETSELARWSDLIAGLHALRTADVPRARSTCEAVLGAPGASRLRAWAASCSAEALERAGDLESAADRLALAWLLGERAVGSGLDQSIPVGPGQHAETAYRAARVALERGRAGEAWEMLARLDALGSDAAPVPTSERDALLAELAALEAPAAPARREQRESIRRTTLERLQELARARSPGGDGRGLLRDSGLAFRAFALDDEVVLLRRPPDGEPVLYRRTAIDRTELWRAVEALAAAMGSRDADDARWRDTARPLALALVPDREDLGASTTFALHGLLQSVPLHALPLPDGTGWLGDATAVALRPAGAASSLPAEPHGAGIDLFVVDPGGNLASRGAARFYRSLAPRAKVLEGESATIAAIEAALADARLLHVDAHARYDPAFPELSALELADGPYSAEQIAARAPGLDLANLSACHSGSWPVTADSGRFGLAGALARRGVRWVVASRAELEDSLATDFNRAFYARLARGESVPDAFRAALRQVSDRHPASSRAALLLLESGGKETHRGAQPVARLSQTPVWP